MAEAHSRVRAYVKNHGLGFEVPYRFQGERRMYWPDFILLVEDGHGEEDLLHLVVEIKGYRQEDAKEKKNTMTTYWLPAVNRLADYGRWDFAEFYDAYEMEAEFDQRLSWDSSPVLQDGFGLQSIKPGAMLESFRVRAGP